MTVITEELALPDGTNPGGWTVTIQLVGENGLPIEGFNSDGNTTVVGRLRVPVAAGSWSADLTPNDVIIPGGTVWKRTITGGGGTGSGGLAWSDYFDVPSGGGPHVLEDVLTDVPGDLPSPQAVTQAILTAAIDDEEARADAAYAPLRWFDVRLYGAVGDGSTNDTAAIQAAIDAALAAGGGIVLVPRSSDHYVITSLTLPGGVALVGEGWDCIPQGPFNNTDFDDPTKVSGSVLRSTATTGVAVSCTVASDKRTHRLEHLAVIGPGSGSGTGIGFGAGDYTLCNHVTNVMVANFSRCWDLSNVMDSTFIACRARGCHVGFYSSAVFNQNVLINTEVQFSDQNALLITDASTNQWLGGLLQNTSGTASLHHVSGEANVYQGFYHEASSSPTDLILIDAGSQNVLRDWWFSTPAGRITIGGGGSNHLQNFRGASNALVLVGTHFLTDVTYSGITGAGAAAGRIIDQTIGIKLGSAGQDVRIPSGKKFFFETTGSNNYIGRDLATGDTEIGSGGATVKTAAGKALKSGAAVTGSRPSAATCGAGARFYDTTLSKPIWSDGTVWRDAAGTAV